MELLISLNPHCNPSKKTKFDNQSYPISYSPQPLLIYSYNYFIQLPIFKQELQLPFHQHFLSLQSYQSQLIFNHQMEPHTSSFVSDFLNMDLTSGYNMFKMTVVCLVAWTYFFFMVEWLVHFPRLDLKSSNDIKNRIVSIVHGLSTFILSFKCLFFEESHNDGPNTQLQHFIIILSMSYVIYDLIACYWYNLFGMGLFVHHSTCIVGYLSALISGHGGALAIGGLFFAEISNFPMHARVICRDFNIRYSRTYELSQNIYLVTYIIARGLFCPIMLAYPSWVCKNIPWVVSIMCNLLILQSLYYISQMYGITLKKLKQYKEMKEKKVEYFWLSVNPEIEKLSFVKKEEKQKIF